MKMVEKIKEIKDRGVRVAIIKTKILELYKDRSPQQQECEWEHAYNVCGPAKFDNDTLDAVINNLAGFVEYNKKQVEDLAIIENDKGYMIVVKVNA